MGPREVSQWLRAMPMAEDVGSNLSIHMMTNTVCNSSPRSYRSLLLTSMTLYAYGVHTCRQNTPTQKYKQINLV